MGRGLKSEASHLYNFVLEKLKYCVHIKLLYGISRSLGKRPWIRNPPYIPKFPPDVNLICSRPFLIWFTLSERLQYDFEGRV